METITLYRAGILIWALGFAAKKIMAYYIRREQRRQSQALARYFTHF